MSDCQNNYSLDNTNNTVEVLNIRKPVLLDQDQLVCEAINLMTAHHCKSLPLQRAEQYIGTIRLKELIRFIETGNPALAYHKLNYSLYSAFYIIRKNKHQYKSFIYRSL
ncbi:hypothetical protein SAMN04488524_3522 [Pedobacter africanus]|uniref:CBS domain-containing protein n=1 Tax=Pedobacter africanus TaxID=151894 RepID=A0A1W2D9U6_9SPHI|nr:hypothetical protein SAMN04488524_3522 [Pedobacter africanus]